MIFDKYWKKELIKLNREIVIWRKMPCIGGVAEHKLSRAVLYSATIIRKIIEDEKETEKAVKESNMPMPKLKILHTSIIAMKYTYVAEEKWTVRGKLFPEDYEKSHKDSVDVCYVCNQLLHSYVWSIARSSTKKEYTGFLVASDFDKEKFVHFISFDEWHKLLNFVIENAAFYV